MAELVLLQFDTDPHCAAHRDVLDGLGVSIAEAEPRWPTFFDIVLRERPAIIVISCGVIPQHGREAARYLGDGFNTRNIPVLLVDVAPRDKHALSEAAPHAAIVDDSELAQAARERLAPITAPRRDS